MPPVFAKRSVCCETGSNGSVSQPSHPGNPAGEGCLVQLIMLVDPEAPVTLKVMGLRVSVPADAVTVFIPRIEPRIRVVEAKPEALVATVAADRVPSPAVTVKVTLVPETGLPPASVTFPVNGVDNCWPTVPV